MCLVCLCVCVVGGWGGWEDSHGRGGGEVRRVIVL